MKSLVPPSPHHQTGVRARNLAIVLLILGAGGLVARRDAMRRALGLKRRSVLEVVAAVLERLPFLKHVGVTSFILSHRSAAYGSGAIALWLLFKYQQRVRRWLRSVLQGSRFYPKDALEDYPVDDAVSEVLSVSEEEKGLRRLPSDGEELALASAAAAESPSEQPQLQLPNSSKQLMGEPVASLPPPPPAREEVEMDAALSALGMRNLTPQRASEVLRFLKLLRHTIHGIDTAAVLSLYSKMERLRLPAGSTIFNAGDGNSDGMYVILRGQLGLLAPSGDAAAAASTFVPFGVDAGVPLCAFSKAQTIGENVLLASTELTHRVREWDSTAVDVASPKASNTPARANNRSSTPIPSFSSQPQTRTRGGSTIPTVVGSVDTLRPMTCIALSDVELLRLDKKLFAWLTEAHPSAVVSFVLSTTARQWRVALFLLVEFLGLKDAWLTSLEAPGSAPAFDFEAGADGGKGGHGGGFTSSTTSSSVMAADVSQMSGAPTIVISPNTNVAGSSSGSSSSTSRSNGTSTATAQIYSPAAAAAPPSVGSSSAPPPPPRRFPAAIPIPLSDLRGACAAVILKQAGETVFEEGDEADAVCVILSGRAVCHVSTLPAVSGPLLYSEHDFTGDEASAALRAMGGNGPLPRGIDPDLVIRCIGPGCIAGGQACLVGTPQSYTCTALEPLEVAVFPRRMFTSMAEDGPEGGETPSTAASRVHAVRRATLLEVTLAIARSLVPLLRLFMSLGLQRLWLKSGEVLFSAGQPQDGLYVVISGRLRTYTGKGGGEAPSGGGSSGSRDSAMRGASTVPGAVSGSSSTAAASASLSSSSSYPLPLRIRATTTGQPRQGVSNVPDTLLPLASAAAAMMAPGFASVRSAAAAVAPGRRVAQVPGGSPPPGLALTSFPSGTSNSSSSLRRAVLSRSSTVPGLSHGLSAVPEESSTRGSGSPSGSSVSLSPLPLAPVDSDPLVAAAATAAPAPLTPVSYASIPNDTEAAIEQQQQGESSSSSSSSLPGLARPSIGSGKSKLNRRATDGSIPIAGRSSSGASGSPSAAAAAAAAALRPPPPTPLEEQDELDGNSATVQLQPPSLLDAEETTPVELTPLTPYPTLDQDTNGYGYFEDEDAAKGAEPSARVSRQRFSAPQGSLSRSQLGSFAMSSGGIGDFASSSNGLFAVSGASGNNPVLLEQQSFEVMGNDEGEGPLYDPRGERLPPAVSPALPPALESAAPRASRGSYSSDDGDDEGRGNSRGGASLDPRHSTSSAASTRPYNPAHLVYRLEQHDAPYIYNAYQSGSLEESNSSSSRGSAGGRGATTNVGSAGAAAAVAVGAARGGSGDENYPFRGGATISIDTSAINDAAGTTRGGGTSTTAATAAASAAPRPSPRTYSHPPLQPPSLSAAADWVRVDIGRGETVGEIAVLIRQETHSSTAICIRDCELVRMTPAAFDIITSRYPSVMTRFTRVLAQRYAALLGSKAPGAVMMGSAGALSPSFRRPQWRTPAAIAQRGGFDSSSSVGGSATPRGVSASSAASAAAATPGGGFQDIITCANGTCSTVRPGGPLGGLTLGSPHRGNAVSFQQPPSPPILSPSEGLRAAIATLPPAPRAQTYITIAIVPAGGTPVPLADFTARLVAALRRTGEGPVLHLTAAKLEAMLGPGTVEQLNSVLIRAKVSAWLSSEESRHRFIVFEAGDAGQSSLNEGEQHTSGVLSGGGSGGYGDARWRQQQGQQSQQQSTGAVAAAVASAATRQLGLRQLGARVRTLGRHLDTAVKAGIGVSPSTMFLSAMDSTFGDRRGVDEAIINALRAAAATRDGGTDGGTTEGRNTRDWRDLTPRRRPASGGADDSGASEARRAAAVASAWTSLCVQQADLCLLVGQAHTPPELSLAERSAVFRECRPSSTGSAGSGSGSPSPSGSPPTSRTFSRKELILLHPDASRRPAGTRFWLRARRVQWHHHLRTLYEADFDRIARHVCGRAVSLVLSGGGSRGLSHLGVLTVLEQRGVDVDVIGGTSQGAFMAACYALTLDSTSCVPLVRRLADSLGSTWQLLNSLTLPILTYFSGSAFNEALQDLFGATQIEDLWIRYFCVSTDVANDGMAVHTTGPLWKYVRASMTLMSLLPPINDRGRLLIDGGYVSNLPVEVAIKIAPQANVVIASDAENKTNSLASIPEYGDSLSGWWLAWRWALSIVRLSDPVRIPSTADVALKISYISHSMMIREMLDSSQRDPGFIYIQPLVSAFKLLDYHRYDVIVSTGTTAAVEALGAWTSTRLDIAAPHEDAQAQLSPGRTGKRVVGGGSSRISGAAAAAVSTETARVMLATASSPTRPRLQHRLLVQQQQQGLQSRTEDEVDVSLVSSDAVDAAGAFTIGSPLDVPATPS